MSLELCTLLGKETKAYIKDESATPELIYKYIILLIKILPLLVEDDRHKVVITTRIKDCLVLLKTASKNEVEQQINEIIRVTPQ